MTRKYDWIQSLCDWLQFVSVSSAWSLGERRIRGQCDPWNECGHFLSLHNSNTSNRYKIANGPRQRRRQLDITAVQVALLININYLRRLLTVLATATATQAQQFVLMTYKSRDRSLTEVLIAVVFVCFFVGFVAVLCIGNYYRARRAMERQRQRRLARLSGNAGNGVVGSTESPKSTTSGASSAHSIEQRNLLGSSNAMSHRPNRDHGGDLLLQHPWRPNSGGVLLWAYNSPSFLESPWGLRWILRIWWFLYFLFPFVVLILFGCWVANISERFHWW